MTNQDRKNINLAIDDFYENHSDLLAQAQSEVGFESYYDHFKSKTGGKLSRLYSNWVFTEKILEKLPVEKLVVVESVESPPIFLGLIFQYSEHLHLNARVTFIKSEADECKWYSGVLLETISYNGFKESLKWKMENKWIEEYRDLKVYEDKAPVGGFFGHGQ